MLGLKFKNGGEAYEIMPNPLGVKEIHVKVPTKQGWLKIDIIDDNVNVEESK